MASTKKQWLTELYWMIALLSAIVLVAYFVRDINLFALEESVDIIIHDTYFVMSPVYALVLIGIPILSFIYFIRIWVTSFKNNLCSAIYVVLNIVLVSLLFITYSFSINNSHSSESLLEGWGLFATIILSILIATVVSLVYTAYRISMNILKR